MTDSERDIDSISGVSYKSRFSISSLSRNSTSGSSLSNCERRRRATATIESLDKNITMQQNLMDNDLKNGQHGDNTALQKNSETLKEIKNNLVSELRTLPPCIDPDCPDHTIISKTNEPVLDFSKPKDKKKPKKRKCKKQDSEGFAFPTKSARPTTPTQVLEPILQLRIISKT
ncbi:hypothetical protein TNCV_4022251 [Trichonephila clavipes]|nr:hypothetical protein TNCV_4022251 [Trichonephila clavipes]